MNISKEERDRKINEFLTEDAARIAKRRETKKAEDAALRIKRREVVEARKLDEKAEKEASKEKQKKEQELAKKSEAHYAMVRQVGAIAFNLMANYSKYCARQPLGMQEEVRSKVLVELIYNVLRAENPRSNSTELKELLVKFGQDLLKKGGF